MLILLIVFTILLAAVTAATVSLEQAKKESLALAVEAAEVKAFLFQEAAIAAEKAVVAEKQEQLARARKVSAELKAHRATFCKEVYKVDPFVRQALYWHKCHNEEVAKAAALQSRYMKAGK